MSGTLTYNGISITREDILDHAMNERSPQSRAFVLRAVQGNIISSSDINNHCRGITEAILKQWLDDPDVWEIILKIEVEREPAESAPTSHVPSMVLAPLVEYRGLSFDEDTARLWWNERSARLSPSEKTALPLFFNAPETVISREVLHETVLGLPYTLGSELPDQIVSDIRMRCLELGMSEAPFFQVDGGYTLLIKS